MKEWWKNMFQQMLMITFGVSCSLALLAVYFAIRGETVTFSMRHMISPVVTGVICPWSSLVLDKVMLKPQKQFLIGVAIHFLITLGIVMGLGYLFQWYTGMSGAVAVLIDFVIIYGFVWAGSYWMGVINQRKINSALDSIRDEE